MNRERSILLPACFLLLLLGSVGVADDATTIFNSLYGPNLQRATATLDKSDDVALAKELLAAAKTAVGKPALFTLICEHVYTLGMTHADGYAAAAEAMTLLEPHSKNRAEAQDKLLTALTLVSRQSSAADRAAATENLVAALVHIGDERTRSEQYDDSTGLYRRALALAIQQRMAITSPLKDRLAFVADRQQVHRQIAILRLKLLEDANDEASARQLVLLHLRDLEDPAGAAKFVERVKDEELREIVRLAARPAGDLNETQLLQLGDWYRSQAEEAGNASVKRSNSRRAIERYRLFLKKHPADDLPRTKATLSLQSAESILTRLGPEPDFEAQLRTIVADKPTKLGEWIELLELIDFEKDVINGKWKRTDNGFSISRAQAAKYVIPVKPRGSYVFKFKFACRYGIIHHYHLPVGNTEVILMLGNGSHANERWHVSGLRKISGKDYIQNESTAKEFRIAADKMHACEVRVQVKGPDAVIEVDINGKKLIRWQGSVSALGHDYPHYKLPEAGLIGIGALWCDIDYEDIKLRMVDDKAELLRSKEASSPNSNPGKSGQ